MKTIKSAIITLIICMALNVSVFAAPNGNYQPISNTYKEGIYKFDSIGGNKMIFKLNDLSKEMKVMLFKDDKLIYLFSLNDTFNEVELNLNKPIGTHTAILVGSGEVNFTFE